ncbi:hypothetical protein [Mycobacterium sp.]|uniref:hypothetical protein n=1 Tax=Mycobacterium sp. TaxID=1785 RepID=UPI003C7091EF
MTANRHISPAEALTFLRAACMDLTAARANVDHAYAGLSDRRADRAAQLVDSITDALAFAQRLTFVVEGDQRAAAEWNNS